jgi:class 3 adenylate cyclase
VRETRKLVAILAADVVGFSRLMGEDGSGTAPAVSEHWEAARPIVAGLGAAPSRQQATAPCWSFLPGVAARLEGICDPGGVPISGAAYDHIRGRIDADFVDPGEKRPITKRTVGSVFLEFLVGHPQGFVAAPHRKLRRQEP